MEALEKDFSDLVASEDTVETDTDQVTAEAGVEDIVQQILSANADQSVDEPTVAEVETAEAETVDEVETEEILEEEDTEEDDEELQTALADEEGWEDVADEDLAEMEEVLAQLKKDNPDIDFDDADIVFNENGEIEVGEGKTRAKPTAQTRADYKRLKRTETGQQKRQKKKSRKGYAKRVARGQRVVKTRTASFDPSEVSADDAVVIGEEDQEIDEYTVGSQTRPTNVTVWRTVGGTLKKVKRWTSKGKKGINKGPKSAGHKTAISQAMKRVWKAWGSKTESTRWCIRRIL